MTNWKQEAKRLQRILEGIIKPNAPDGMIIIGYRHPELIGEVRKKLTEDPLYRERDRREGSFYDHGEPFKDLAHHLVYMQSRKMNIVVKTSEGLIAEATPTELRLRRPGEKNYEVIKRLNPQDLISPPFHVQLSCALACYLEDGLKKGYKVEIETNVHSPFLSENQKK